MVLFDDFHSMLVSSLRRTPLIKKPRKSLSNAQPVNKFCKGTDVNKQWDWLILKWFKIAKSTIGWKFHIKTHPLTVNNTDGLSLLDNVWSESGFQKVSSSINFSYFPNYFLQCFPMLRYFLGQPYSCGSDFGF